MAAAIEIRNFSCGYSDQPQVLCDINLVIEPGRKVAIIGPNGAGKSTLLLAMSGFVKGAGKITIDGLEVCPKNAKALRRTITSVSQNPDDQLFMPTLFEDVAFGPMNMGLKPGEIEKRTAETLEKVGLGSFRDRPPHHLSAGQKRCAAIATVLSMDPEIITADEPDTSLDPRTRNSLIELLASLKQTLVIATCNMNFAARLCQRAVLIDQGRIIADGDAAKLMGDSQLMQRHGLETASGDSGI